MRRPERCIFPLNFPELCLMLLSISTYLSPRLQDRERVVHPLYAEGAAVHASPAHILLPPFHRIRKMTKEKIARAESLT